MKVRKRIEVCITVDTEFSIGGNFDNPDLPPIAEPIVLGEIDGKEHGLGFLLDSFSEFGVCATFFVEAMQTAYFGCEPMGGIARRITKAEQDVQLHLHPCWLYYESALAPHQKRPPNDSCAGRDDAELDYFFQFGLSAFSRWGLPKPTVVRAGNFEVDVNFYRAAARSGITLSSSIALPVYCPAVHPRVFLRSKCRIEQVLEFPVSCYSYPLGRSRQLRPLAITACSSAEILSALCQAREYGISPVIILTHPQEYVKRRDARYARLRRNRVNQARLKTVLRFLQQHDDEFVVLPIHAIGHDHRGTIDPDKPRISISTRQAMARMAENAINDIIWWY